VVIRTLNIRTEILMRKRKRLRFRSERIGSTKRKILRTIALGEQILMVFNRIEEGMIIRGNKVREEYNYIREVFMTCILRLLNTEK
jgi:hypothetical protein